jgi:glycosyltransferase involved in cell wall biosynthesis
MPYAGARDSGRQDQYHYIASLSQDHQVSLIAFTPPDEQFAVQEMKAICKQVVGIPYREQALSARLWRLGWRILHPQVFGRVVSLPYRSALQKLLGQTTFDVVIVDGMMSRYGLMVKNAKRILDEVDIYAVVAYNIYRHKQRALPRFLALYDWLRTLAVEMGNAERYDGILVRSEKDLHTMRNFLPQKAIAVLPPWFEGLDELQKIPIQRPTDHKILFSGAMNLPPNEEAAVYFANHVYPLIKSCIADATFYIVGNSPTPEVKALAEVEGVTVTGQVESLQPYYEMCAVSVVPLFTGGGVIVKTLNGMASGRPTVTNVIGNSGTGAKSGHDLLVVPDDPAMFAESICQLLNDEAMWYQYAWAGRQFIEANYSWQKTIGDLTRFLDLMVQA